MFYLTACLIFKDAASYLEEWIRFHKRVGVEHFYLYDNDSEDDYESVIRRHVEQGDITLYKWPGAAQHDPVIQHCLDQHRRMSRWIAFLDDDEFLFPAAENDLRDVLSQYEPYAGVAVSWLLFGSNGHRARPSGSVLENYRKRADWIDPHVKCVVDPSRAISPSVSAHAFNCLAGETVVDEMKQPLSGPFREQPSADVLCLNHYLTKSHEEMIRRRTRLKVDGTKELRTIAEWEELDAQYNSVQDLRIQRFLKEKAGSLRALDDNVR